MQQCIGSTVVTKNMIAYTMKGVFSYDTPSKQTAHIYEGIQGSYVRSLVP